MKKNKESVILGRLLEKIAPSIGASVLLEPEWKIAGQISFKSGKHSYFRYNTLDLNPVGSSDIAKDKDYSNFFMKSLGYPTIPKSKTFYSQAWADAIGSPKRNIDAAYIHATKIGFPVVVKPNSGSQGANVAVVENKKEFYQAMRRIFKSDRIALVQQCVQGKDYRLVVLDKKIVSAYQRIPLSIVGNGRATIAQLLRAKQKSFSAVNRNTLVKLDDPRIIIKLKRQKLAWSSVLPKNERLFLLDNANLSSGGDSIDVTDKVHPVFKKLAIKLTADMGLRLCGVDLMIEGDISEKPKTYWVLEINAAPGLDHYVKSGDAQKKVVENLYREVLQHMER